MATFKAIVIEKTETGSKARLADFDERNLMDGDVTLRVEWSTLNYKDGLAITGKAPMPVPDFKPIIQAKPQAPSGPFMS